ncbi:hypothetical protein C8Q74DRAFT_500212 [Fomes fomentarius]|nr:hypothetical protein C8Q74DRAFT_500212 [Fomes fomentarius]
MEHPQQQLTSLLEYGGSVVEKVQREFMPKLFERIEAFGASMEQNDEGNRNTEEFKLTTVQFWGGLFLLWLFLPVVFGIVKGMLGLVFIPFMPIIWVLRLVWFLLRLIVKSILWLFGFQPGGVKKGSVAASSQSRYYGPYTRGAFSSMQAMGATDVEL